MDKLFPGEPWDQLNRKKGKLEQLRDLAGRAIASVEGLVGRDRSAGTRPESVPDEGEADK